VPDIACYSKGLIRRLRCRSPVTLCGPKIFDAHYSEDRSKTFFHSSSYTANPIACAAAVANLKGLAGRAGQGADRGPCRRARQGARRISRRPTLRPCPPARHHSGTRLVVNDAGYLAGIGPRLYRHFMDRRFLVRPLGNTIYLMPPYCSTADEIGALYRAIAEIDLTRA